MKHFTRTFIFDEEYKSFQDLERGDFFLDRDEIYIKISEIAAIKFSENRQRHFSDSSAVYKRTIK